MYLFLVSHGDKVHDMVQTHKTLDLMYEMYLLDLAFVIFRY